MCRAIGTTSKHVPSRPSIDEDFTGVGQDKSEELSMHDLLDAFHAFRGVYPAQLGLLTIVPSLGTIAHTPDATIASLNHD